MITTTWTVAPAGFLGLGGSNPRSNAARGTAVPFGGDQRALVETVGKRPVEDVRFHNFIAPNDGTTLGIHLSGRPLS
jgi:hypothetical protein